MKNKHYIEIPRIRIPIWLPNLQGNWRAWLPNRGNVLFTLLVISALFWAQSAGALPLPAPAAPNTSTGTIAYQGRLADAGGAPLTGTYSMIFRLYNVATGSAPLWTEQWTGPNSVQVSDGLFNVMLGSLASIPQAIVTGNANLWLGITVGADNEMLPRVQLGSVPFAVQALTVPDGSITQAKLAPDINLIPPAGSITTTMLADRAVTAVKTNLSAKQVFTTTAVSVGPAHAQLDDLVITFAAEEIPANAYIAVDWHASVYDNANIGCRAAAGVRLDGATNGFPDSASIGEVGVAHTGMTQALQALSGSTLLPVSSGAHTVTLVLIAEDCGTRVFYGRSVRAFLVGR